MVGELGKGDQEVSTRKEDRQSGRGKGDCLFTGYLLFSLKQPWLRRGLHPSRVLQCECKRRLGEKGPGVTNAVFCWVQQFISRITLSNNLTDNREKIRSRLRRLVSPEVFPEHKNFLSLAGLINSIFHRKWIEKLTLRAQPFIEENVSASIKSTSFQTFSLSVLTDNDNIYIANIALFGCRYQNHYGIFYG